MFSFQILSENNIEDKGAEELSKGISFLAICPLINLILNLS
jgi:hypothetical protein